MGALAHDMTTHSVTIQILLTVCQMQIAAKGGRYCSPGYFVPFISV